MRLQLCVLSMAIFATFLISAQTISKRQGFAAACNPYTLDGTVLHGTCATDDKQTMTTSLDLNQCIGNAFGGLAVSFSVAVSCKYTTTQSSGKPSKFYSILQAFRMVLKM
jgi:hypothetical protein